MSAEALTFASSALIFGSGLSLVTGWYFIRFRRNMTVHKRFMLLATGLAAAFLVVYVTRWNIYGSRPFEGSELMRNVYLAILVPHIILAMVLPPAVGYLLNLSLRRKDYPKHRKYARVVFPIWLFVAASGWAIYFMLY